MLGSTKLLKLPTLLAHHPVRTFTTLAGLFYVFLIDGRERTCHETNALLRRAP